MKLSDPFIIRNLALVDNDDDDEFFMRRTLRQAGIGTHVLRLHGGKEAISYLARSGPYADLIRFPAAELIFLDVNMPGCSGFDVLIWLQRNPQISRPFVAMLSGSDLPRDIARAKQLGADGYMSKPPTPENLREFTAQYGMSWVKVTGSG